MKTKILVGGALILFALVMGGFVNSGSVDTSSARVILTLAFTCAISGIIIALLGTIESLKKKGGGK